MPSNPGREWSLTELAAEAGMPARTIRFYIARGLLDGPLHAGRGATYGSRHLERLRRISELRNQGLTLAEISVALGIRRQTGLAAPETWWQYRIGEDVMVSLRAGMSPWRVKQITTLLERLVREQREGKETSQDDA
jgi:DNA-binding transcriptional MerR regulator